MSRAHSVVCSLVLAGCVDAVGVGVPYLEGPSEIPLGAVPVDALVPVRIEVRNNGTAHADAQVRAPAGSQGPVRLTVPAGGTAALDLRVVFPTLQTETLTVRLIAGDSQVTVRLRGEPTGDLDGDGFDDASLGGPDCDDTDPNVHPGVPEICDARDQDCDGAVDELDAPIPWYTDADGDGWGSPVAPTFAGCQPPPGLVANADDCLDTAPTVYPGAPEIWYDGVDQDCDGNDADRDLDGWIRGPDCDDDDPAVHPGMPELDDGVDQDCDGAADEDFLVPGDVVISELHLEPSVPGAAYVEIVAIGRGVEPGLLTLGAADVTPRSAIPAGGVGLICAPSAPAVLPCDGWVPLDPTGDVSLSITGVLLDVVDPVSVGALAGAAIELDPARLDVDANDLPTAWCVSGSVGPAGDAGSPGSLPTPWCAP